MFVVTTFIESFPSQNFLESYVIKKTVFFTILSVDTVQVQYAR